MDRLHTLWHRALASTRGRVAHDPVAAHLDRLTTHARRYLNMRPWQLAHTPGWR